MMHHIKNAWNTAIGKYILSVRKINSTGAEITPKTFIVFDGVGNISFTDDYQNATEVNYPSAVMLRNAARKHLSPSYEISIMPPADAKLVSEIIPPVGSSNFDADIPVDKNNPDVQRERIFAYGDYLGGHRMYRNSNFDANIPVDKNNPDIQRQRIFANGTYLD